MKAPPSLTMTGLLLSILLLLVSNATACRSHAPVIVRQVQTFIGTVGQGCTPTTITAVTQLITDPTRCELNLAPGCNLCKLRLYIPETAAAPFLVLPLRDDDKFGVVRKHVPATECRCVDGCYFHKSSITRQGINPLPKGRDGTVDSFSEPFACYSGFSMPSAVGTQSFTFMIWCENDGGCPNGLVAKYQHFTRLEQLSPNRPPVKDNFTPKITTLPTSKCLFSTFSRRERNFLVTDPKSGKDGKGGGRRGRKTPTPSPSPSKSPITKGLKCYKAQKFTRCVRKCMDDYS